MKIKIVAMLLAMVACLTFVACDSKEADDEAKKTTKVEAENTDNDPVVNDIF